MANAVLETNFLTTLQFALASSIWTGLFKSWLTLSLGYVKIQGAISSLGKVNDTVWIFKGKNLLIQKLQLKSFPVQLETKPRVKYSTLG